MARQVSESSVASAHSTNPNWWDIHANPISSWNSWQQQQQQPEQKLTNPNPSSCKEPDISISPTSFTNVSDKSEEPTVLENNLWNHVLFTGNGGGDFHKNHGDHHGENFNLLETLSSKNLPADMFGPACDYLKKLDESWELSTPIPFTTISTGKLIDQETPTNLSDLVSNWSIAPPQPKFDHHHAGSTTTGRLGKHIELQQNSSPYSSCSYSGLSGGSGGDTGILPFTYGDEMSKVGVSQPSYDLGKITVDDHDTGFHQHVGLGNSITEIGGRYAAASDAPWSNTRNFTDLINFGGSVSNKQFADCHVPNIPCSVRERLDSSDSRKQGKEVIGGKVKGGAGKKKRAEKTSDAVLKKSKHESSNLSSTKLQVPKVKLGEKITALQQIVSPFGKTDTASVLMEAINYIKFLHEQVQLYSHDPFMKSGAGKDLIISSWGGMESKDKNEIKQLDLSSRGLCLVPISCTPQIYRENMNGPDCWTPTYRGFLYR